jgi:MFS family permease
LATEIAQPNIGPGTAPDPKASRALLYATIVVFVGIAAITLSTFQAIGLIPLKNLLKNELHESRAATAAFAFWLLLPWYFKPFFGIVTDAFPFLGTRRKSYTVFGATLSAAGFVLLIFTPHRYYALLAVCIVIDLFMVITSTAVGGFMTEKAQELRASGRFAAIFQIAYQMSGVIGGPLGGLLGAVAFGWTGVAGAAITFSVVPAAIFFLREQRRKVDSKKILSIAGQHLANAFSSKTMWAAAGFSFLFYCAPGIQTALFYRQQDVLHMTTGMQGFMLFLNGIFGVLAAAVYGSFACKRWSLRKLLLWCIIIGAFAQMGYALYSTMDRAYIIECLWGLGWSAADMSLCDLYMRATPAGSEGLGFALMVSVRNFSLFGADWLGSRAMDAYHIHFSTMCIANGLISLIAVPFIFFLPGFIVDRKDSSAEAEALPPPTGKALLEE